VENSWRYCLEPECDFEGLFAVGRHRGATVANLGGMDDPEIDLRLDPPRAFSFSFPGTNRTTGSWSVRSKGRQK